MASNRPSPSRPAEAGGIYRSDTHMPVGSARARARACRGQPGTGASGRVGSDLSKSPNPLARERFGLFAMPGVIAIPNRPAGIGFGMLTRSGFRRQPAALVDTTY